MSVSVYRDLKSGNTEETVYKVRLLPEDATCVIRTLKRATRASIEKQRDRIERLEEEL
jgi:hypothetical protein